MVTLDVGIRKGPGSGLTQIIFLMETIILHSQNNLLLWDSFGIYEGGGGDITSLFYVFHFTAGGRVR